MNPRYRKQQRLRTRHAKQGHTTWCLCPEELVRMDNGVKRWYAALILRDALNNKLGETGEEEWIGTCPCAGNDMDCIDDDRNWKPKDPATNAPDAADPSTAPAHPEAEPHNLTPEAPQNTPTSP